MQEWLERQWYRVSPWHIFLLPLSLVFFSLAWIRRRLYHAGILKSVKLPVPVIVIGNITVGGAGKTPLAIWLAKFLREYGYSPGIISRGYGGTANQPTAVSGATNPRLAGDEAVLIARRTGCPVWIGKKRADAGLALLQAHSECDVLISDDGLQHYALARDVEIVVIDVSRHHGNCRLLPAGPLREPPSRLRTVDAVVAHGGEAAGGEFAMRLVGDTFRNLVDPSLTASIGDFSALKLHAVAGIGNPQRFFRHLEMMGLKCACHAFPDHYSYQPADLQFAGAQAVLMTEKDAVKCAAFALPHWWYLEVDAQVSDALGDLVLRKLRS